MTFSPCGSNLLVNLGGEQIYLFDINTKKHSLLSDFRKFFDSPWAGKSFSVEKHCWTIFSFFLKTAAFTEHQRVTDTVYTRRMDFRRQLYSRMDLLSYFNRWQLLPIPFQSKKTTLNENFVRETGSDFFAAIRNAHRYRRERIF